MTICTETAEIKMAEIQKAIEDFIAHTRTRVNVNNLLVCKILSVERTSIKYAQAHSQTNTQTANQLSRANNSLCESEWLKKKEFSD